MRRSLRASRRAGITLLELLVATALGVVVLGAVLTVTQNALRIWTRGEVVRDAREVAEVALGAIADDLRQLHPSAEGDLLVDWQPFDLERDGQTERVWPRIRLVRDVSGAERDAIERRGYAWAARVARGDARGPDGKPLPEGLDEEELLTARGLTRAELGSGAVGATRDVEGGAVAEVLFAVVPEGAEGTERVTGVLLRAERLHVPGRPLEFFGEDAFLPSHFPAPELGAQELVGGVLWLEPLLATQTSNLAADTGWRVTAGTDSVATSWDAWRLGRPDIDVSGRNEPTPGAAPAGIRPRLPRVVRLSVEVARPNAVRRAPSLVDGVGPEDNTIEVTTTRHLHGVVGSHVLVGPEWMEVRAVDGDRLSVVRGRRATTARSHVSGTKVLLGAPASIDVPIALHADDWTPLSEGATR